MMHLPLGCEHADPQQIQSVTMLGIHPVCKPLFMLDQELLCHARLGTSKQKWTDEEEKALRFGVDKWVCQHAAPSCTSFQDPCEAYNLPEHCSLELALNFCHAATAAMKRVWVRCVKGLSCIVQVWGRQVAADSER